MAKFKFAPLAGERNDDITARVGDGSPGTAAAGTNLTDADRGKFVKLVGESRYGLCAAGDEIEGWLISTEVATLDGFQIGTVRRNKRMWATASAPLTVGASVVCGPVTARGTALAEIAGTVGAGTPAAGTAAQVQAGATTKFHWRVVSLGPVGTGAAGTVVLIERE